jgi:hypothetical protein
VLPEAGAPPPAGAVASAEAAPPAKKPFDFKIGDETTWIKPGFLLQPWLFLGQERSGGSLDLRFSPYLRRTRLMLTAQLNDTINFFFETDSPDFGKYGDFSPTIFPQDAYVEINVHPALQIDAGLLYAPFSHQGMQGATTLLALDYHSKLMRPPAGGNKVWRDVGVMLRGMPFDNWIEYRVAVVGGVHGNMKNAERTAKDSTGTDYKYNEPSDPRNQNDLPRVLARLTFNVFDAEGGPGVGGYFYKGVNLKKTPEGTVTPKTILAFGASFDYQRDLNYQWGPVPLPGDTIPRSLVYKEDYFAFDGDAYFDIPINDAKTMAVDGQLDFYYYNYGNRAGKDTYWDTYDAVQAAAGKPGSGAYTGYGIAAEVGFRYDMIAPVFGFDWYKSTKAPKSAIDDETDPDKKAATGDYIGLQGGVNWYYMANNVTFKLYGGGNRESGGRWARFLAVQSQLLF